LRFVSSAAESEPGDRLKRLRRRRRLLREELLVVLFLLLALAATVAVLATQWLESGASTGTGASSASGIGSIGLTGSGAHGPSSFHILNPYTSLSNLGGSP
jgi:hypothetical protein